jgi:cell division septation protein DedD
VLKKENFENRDLRSTIGSQDLIREIDLQRENLQNQPLPPSPPQTPEPKHVRFEELPTAQISTITPEPPTQDQQEEIQQLLKTGIREDENTASVLSAIEQKKNRHPFLQLAQCEAKGELLYYHDKIYVPEYEDLRTKVIRQHHDNPSAGHPGRTKTFELVSCHYC